MELWVMARVLWKSFWKWYDMTFLYFVFAFSFHVKSLFFFCFLMLVLGYFTVLSWSPLSRWSFNNLAVLMFFLPRMFVISSYGCWRKALHLLLCFAFIFSTDSSLMRRSQPLERKMLMMNITESRHRERRTLHHYQDLYD